MLKTKKTKSIRMIILATVLNYSVAIGQEAKQWKIDKSHSSVNFSIDHLFSEVTGKFKNFDGTINFDQNNLKNSKATFIIKVASVNTDDTDRDSHLQSEDFFAAQKFQEITFESFKFEKVNDKEYNVYGKLTIRGVAKNVKLPLKITGLIDNPWKAGSVIMGVSISTTLKRSDFGIGTGSWAASTIVGDEVRVKIVMELDAEK